MESRRPKRFFKGLPTTWGRDVDRETEAKAARESFYYWWWAFLSESMEYRRAVTGRKEEPYASMAADFGRLGTSFETWWFERGREIFVEPVAIPRVRKMEHGDMANYEGVNPKLIIEMPLTIRRQTILRQVNKLLDQHHAGSDLRVHAYSRAKRRLYPHQRIRKATLETLMKVWQARKAKPDAPWWETGEELRLSPYHTVTEKDDAATIANKHRIMALTVQRMHRKAKAIIDFAAKGDFPRYK
jgi:hypothetical protein